MFVTSFRFLFISLVLTSCQAKPKSKKEKKKKEINNTKDFLLAQKSSSSLAVKTDDDDNDDTSSDLTSRTKKDDQTSSLFGFETEEVVAGAPSCGKPKKNDAVVYPRLESCCKIHKKCPLKISPKKRKWGVNNNVDFTLYDCKCDKAFYDCLKTIKRSASYSETGMTFVVGKGYFDTYETPCVAIPDGVKKKEKEKPMKDDGTQPDAANDMNNNDNKPKARLVKAKSYANGKKQKKEAQKSNTAKDDNATDI